jgi:hypothetical protein
MQTNAALKKRAVESRALPLTPSLQYEQITALKNPQNMQTSAALIKRAVESRERPLTPSLQYEPVTAFLNINSGLPAGDAVSCGESER